MLLVAVSEVAVALPKTGDVSVGLPVQLVNIPLEGVPSAGVIKIGLPVQLLILPLAGVPNAGVISVGLVMVGALNINALVICLVTLSL